MSLTVIHISSLGFPGHIKGKVQLNLRLHAAHFVLLSSHHLLDVTHLSKTLTSHHHVCSCLFSFALRLPESALADVLVHDKIVPDAP